jgi:hypothetical protein
MNNQTRQDGLQCSQFEALLADALDGVLTAEVQRDFDAHGRTCPLCGPMLAEAREGMFWLESLEDVEPPKNLIHNILAATSMAVTPSGEPSQVRKARTGFRPILAAFFRSRFATSFSMAFFSLSLTLTVAGVRISDLGKVDWHPSALRKALVLQYTHVESSVVRYYENMRLVYEVETRVRELRKATTPAEDTDKKEKPKEKGPNDTSGSPEQHPDYSMDREGTVIAKSMSNNQGAQI